jgi:hypothetical protein
MSGAMARGLDHLVLAARDLDAEAALYRRLGFTVGVRNRHPWGTLNHIVQFPAHFLELISTEPGFAPPDPSAPVARFAGFLDRYLAAREGFAMLVLESKDAAADQADFAAGGIAVGSPFHFSRTGRQADGSAATVAFTLVFAADPGLPDAGFFVCQQHAPAAFWNPAAQDHPNTVLGVNGVSIAAADPGAVLPFLQRFVGRRDGLKIPTGYQLPTGRGSVEVMTAAGLRQVFGPAILPEDPTPPRLVAVRFFARDIAAVRAVLRVGEVAFAEHRKFIVVPPAAAFGVALVFEPAA